jgi:hypothetical protein
MILLEVQPQYIELGVFVTIILAMFSLIVGGFALLLSKLGSVKKEVTDQGKIIAVVASDNESDKTNISKLWQTVNNINQQRTTDTIKFTETVGNLNVTLGKIEVTLENVSKVIVKMDQRLEDQDKVISELKKEKK